MKIFKVFLNKYEWISTILMGVICLKSRPYIYAFFPVIFGIFMFQCGLWGCIEAWKKGITDKENQRMFEYEAMKILVASGIMIRQNEAFITAAIFWGLAGLLKSARYMNQIISQIIKKEMPSIGICVEFLMELVLSMILIFEPMGKVEHHILILGVRLLADGIFGLLDHSKHKFLRSIKKKKWKPQEEMLLKIRTDNKRFVLD